MLGGTSLSVHLSLSQPIAFALLPLLVHSCQLHWLAGSQSVLLAVSESSPEQEQTKESTRYEVLQI